MEDNATFKIENEQDTNIVKNPRSNLNGVWGVIKKKKKLLLILYSLT